MTDSILDSIKKVLGVSPDDTSFDVDIIMHINSTLGTLQQLGIGAVDGFAIEDKTATWADFLGTEKTLNAVKTYVFLKVKLLFDPPATSFGIAAMENQIREHEWRLNVRREEVKYPWEGGAIVAIPGSSSS